VVAATLGIDLASQPKHTALCAIAWDSGRAQVAALVRGVDDDAKPLRDELLVAAMRGRWRRLPAPSKVAIDTPLGWPVDFVRGVCDPAAWPVGIDGDRRRLERRATDHWIHRTTGKLPLSVSTDRIAYPAMRAAGLLAHYAASSGEAVDRTGVTGLVCEAYPDPAIRRFGLWPGDAGARESYKGEARPLRERIVAALVRTAPWLELTSAHRRACGDWDDCLDALVCALVARAVERGLTAAPPAELADEARSEGWIHVPAPQALPALV
jgi:Protein of unknown function (DUF429)